MHDDLPYIIAEAGSCHEGRQEHAMQLIATAKHSGANAIKFQYWSDPSLMRTRRKITDTNAYNEGSIKAEWLPAMRKFCDVRGIDLICSVFLKQDIGLLDDYVDAFKISSFEALDGDLVKACPKSKPLIISTGMCDAKDIGHIIGFVDRAMVLLTCVSAYPCPMEQACLSAMHDGYSDHTKNVSTGALAVAAGAKFLEVHFRLANTSPACPDYCVALTPRELIRYIDFARLAQKAMGYSGRPECETPNRKYRLCSS